MKKQIRLLNQEKTELQKQHRKITNELSRRLEGPDSFQKKISLGKEIRKQENRQEAAELKREKESLQKDNEELKKQLTTANKTQSITGKNLEELTAKNKELNKQAEDHATELATLTSRLEAEKKELANNFKKEEQKLNNAIAVRDTKIKAQAADLTAAIKRRDELNTENRKLGKKVDDLTTEKQNQEQTIASLQTNRI